MGRDTANRYGWLLGLLATAAAAASPTSTPAPATDPRLEACARSARNQPAESIALAEQVLAEPDRPLEAELRALACLGIAQAVSGKPAEAIATAERIVSTVDANPALSGEGAYVIGQAGGIFQTLGQTARAAALYQRGYELTQKDGTPRARVLALLNLAGLQAGGLNDPQAAQPFFDQALALAEENGLATSYMYFNVGLNLSRLQRGEAALQRLERAAALAAQDGGQEGVRFRADSLRGEILAAAGRADLARPLLDAAIAAQRRSGDNQGLVASLRRLSAVALRDGKPEAALAEAEEALRLTEQGQYEDELVQGYEQLAAVYVALGRSDDALALNERRYRREIDALRRQNLASIAAQQAEFQNAAESQRVQQLELRSRINALSAERERLRRDLAVLALALTVGAAVSLSFVYVRANRRLRRLSDTDPLTGLMNRRFGASRLAALPQGQDARHVLFLIDADGFKPINDSHGHAAGDEVLVELAQRLRACCRPGDLVARWGGEEFLIACPQIGHADAQAFAERVRSQVAGRPFGLSGGRQLAVTVSIGFAPLPFYPGGEAGDWHAVAAVADQALYAAKKSGRNAWAGLWGTAAAAAGATPPQPAELAAGLARGAVEASSSRSAAWASDTR